MAASPIILPKDFSIQRTTLSAPKGPDNKAKTVYVSYDNDKLMFQTPNMPLPFGLSKWDNDGKGPTKYSIDLSFKERETNADVARFFDMISAVDDLAKRTAVANKATWFKGKKYTDEMIPTLFTPSIKYAKDKNTKEVNLDYPPTFKVTLPFNADEGAITTKVYDVKKNLVNPLDMTTKNGRALLIVQCGGIWISSTGFGVQWRGLQMRLEPPTHIKDYAFLPVEDDLVEESDAEDDAHDDAKEAAAEVPAQQAQQAPAKRGAPSSASSASATAAAAPKKKEPAPKDIKNMSLDDEDDDDL